MHIIYIWTTVKNIFFLSVLSVTTVAESITTLEARKSKTARFESRLPELQRVCCLLPRGVQHLTGPTTATDLHSRYIHKPPNRSDFAYAPNQAKSRGGFRPPIFEHTQGESYVRTLPTLYTFVVAFSPLPDATAGAPYRM